MKYVCNFNVSEAIIICITLECNGRYCVYFAPVLNAACLSDEAGKGEGKSFTGNFVGMIAFDTSGSAAEAQFTRFSYTGNE